MHERFWKGESIDIALHMHPFWQGIGNVRQFGEPVASIVKFFFILVANLLVRSFPSKLFHYIPMFPSAQFRRQIFPVASKALKKYLLVFCSRNASKSNALNTKGREWKMMMQICVSLVKPG